MRSFCFRLAAFFCAVILAVCVSVSVFPSASATEDTEVETLDDVQIQEVTEVSDVVDSGGFDSSDIISVDIKTAKSPVTSEDADGLKAIVLGLIGSYDMVTTEYTYTSSNGYTSKQVTTEPDYAWMFSAGFFAIVLYSLFRVLGVIVKHD